MFGAGDEVGWCKVVRVEGVGARQDELRRISMRRGAGVRGKVVVFVAA